MKLAAAQEELSATSSAVEACTARAAEASTLQANLAAELPPLRDAEAARSAALHRLIVERDALEAEEQRAREAAQRLRQRIAQAEQDKERERALDADAEAALAKLNDEAGVLDAAAGRAETDIGEAEAKARELNEALAEADRTLDRVTAELAEWNARKASNERSRDVAKALAETSAAQLSEAQTRLDAAMGNAAAAPDVIAAEAQAEGARGLTEVARNAFSIAREALELAELEEEEARKPLERAEIEVQQLAAETKALSELLNPEGAGLWPPLVDAVKVQPGYEAALAAALGDDLQAPLDEAAPAHWRDLGDFTGLAGDPRTLPSGAQPLSKFVVAPKALARRLDMTGVVFPDQGVILQKQLKPGQRLVSPRGDLWRWDGYAASADAPSPAAVRLSQRNRLVALEDEMAKAKEVRAAAFARYDAAKVAANQARAIEESAERDARDSEQSLISAQDNATKSARAAAERASRLASLESEIRRLTQSRDAALEAEREATAELENLGDGVALVASAADARGASATARTDAGEARATLDGFRRERDARAQRLGAIGEDRARWQLRRDAAATQVAELDRRREELTVELTAAEAVPTEIATRRNTLLDAISVAEGQRNEAADARTKAESRLSDADRQSKVADSALSSAREDRARAQALHEGAEARIAELTARIRDELDCEPVELGEKAEIEEGQELPALEQAEKRVERLKQEREQLGGVNLRAEEEASEHEVRLTTLVADRNDLQGAIDRLRRGIQSLNREGRERLIESFEKVNKNFQELFTKLFQGGEAKLTFTESEDPLEAGLEIFARPPGKRLQSLALLSGGEQALTAMALILAVFLVNPAPVCVLDEVDAPLDDANVERFCNLLDEMTRLTDTRFLVITHHALTMSRMHRLFGVTMAERGVSQLVSVSLSDAERVAAE